MCPQSFIIFYLLGLSGKNKALTLQINDVLTQLSSVLDNLRNINLVTHSIKSNVSCFIGIKLILAYGEYSIFLHMSVTKTTEVSASGMYNQEACTLST